MAWAKMRTFNPMFGVETWMKRIGSRIFGRYACIEPSERLWMAEANAGEKKFSHQPQWAVPWCRDRNTVTYAVKWRSGRIICGHHASSQSNLNTLASFQPSPSSKVTHRRGRNRNEICLRLGDGEPTIGYVGIEAGRCRVLHE